MNTGRISKSIKDILNGQVWKVLKKSIGEFGNNGIMKKSASLAFYTIFSLGPLLFVIIFLAGLFFESEAIEGRIYDQIKNFIGPAAAAQVQIVLKNAALKPNNVVATIIGGATLLLGATTMFSDMQDSINQIWNLKPNPKKGILKIVVTRLLSFGVIASLSFLLLVSLFISTLVASFSTELESAIPGVAIEITYILNLVVSFFIITLFFLIVFKMLPDACIRWKDVLSGAIATALLFMIGKFGITFYLSKSSLGTTYGAAGSLVILLLWVYYASVILYFGAEFTKAWAIERGAPIYPNSYAVTAKKMEVETGNDSLQEAERKFEKMEKENRERK